MSAASSPLPDEVSVYRDGFDHIADELRWLDAVIALRIAAFRELLQGLDQAATGQQMYISHGEVDWLLGSDAAQIETATASSAAAEAVAALRRTIDLRCALSLEQGVPLALAQLGHMFSLSPLERQALIVCLAPELDPKYDRLYAYLHDDVTRKRPSARLILELLCPMHLERWEARALLAEQGSLMRTGLLLTIDDAPSPSGSSDVAKLLRLDPAILDFILRPGNIDPRCDHALHLIAPFSATHEAAVDAQVLGRLQALMARVFLDSPMPGRLVINLHGPDATAARELAVEACRPMQRQLLCLDVESLLSGQRDDQLLVNAALRQSLLFQAPVLVENMNSLLEVGNEHAERARWLARGITQYCQLAFLVTDKPWHLAGHFHDMTFHSLGLPFPNAAVRETVWRRELQPLPEAQSDWPPTLARQLSLGLAQIAEVVSSARNECAMAEREATITDLFAAYRRRSSHTLGDLALKIEPTCDRQDLILPTDKSERLQELCAQVKHRYQVFDEWGFGARLSHGKGLNALFAGPPGTGKTMAAEVIANDLGVDLYKVDLSSVVSKYIGETEKNLAKIFREAADGHAILFFDEADALFGKRTEVSDAHDRYANIETSYLLQKMEEYEGVAILASNLRENMDQAFVRRLRFIIEFPFPDETCRRRIWRTHFPKSAPLSDDIDFDFLGRHLQIAGGSIKNVVLNAAFMAAADGSAIGMKHVLQSAKREFEKIGKRWDAPALPIRTRIAA